MKLPLRSGASQVLLVLSLLLSSANAFPKFQHWFPRSALTYAHINRGVCNNTYNQFQDYYRELGSPLWVEFDLHKSSPIYDYCNAHMSCILNNVTEAKKANLGSSTVMLGLLPTLLAVLSPSVAELALLSIHRPILSTLISLGAPGVLQTRVFSYEDPAETLDLPDQIHAVTRLSLALGPWGKTTSLAISAFEYLMVFVAGANMLWLAYDLGTRSINNWACTASWPPLLWALFPVVIHMIGVYGYRLTLHRSDQFLSAPPLTLEKQRSFFTSPVRTQSSHNALPPPSSEGKTASVSGNEIPLLPMSTTPVSPGVTKSTSSDSGLLGFLKREILPCAAHPLTVINNRLPISSPSTRAKLGILLNCVAGFLSCLHLLFGTVVFSSLNFIDMMDAFCSVTLRFLASSTIARLIILVEIAGIRGARLRLLMEGKTHGDAIVVTNHAGPPANGTDQGGAQARHRKRSNGRLDIR
jgi:hypothetical protein